MPAAGVHRVTAAFWHPPQHRRDRQRDQGNHGNKKLSFKDQRDLDRLPGEVDRLEREIAEAEEHWAIPTCS